MADIDRVLGYGGEEEGMFRFGEKALADLCKLQEQVGAPYPAAVLHYALRWLQFFVDEGEKGNKPCLEITAENVSREVIMPHTLEGCWEHYM